ncbi:MAG: caspase family protein, partial [Myxococcota bacterium]
MITGWLALASWVLSPAAWANVYRFGLFVGNNEGQPGDVELVFAEADAEKMRDLFVDYGEIKPSDAVLLQGAGAGAVQREFERLSGQIEALVGDGHEAVFVFYYSGHGDDDSLHLGATKIEHVNLRTWIERTHAQVRIGLVDACQSGGLVRQKGGERGGSLAFSEPEVESVHGSAIITSSSASELSQESEEIGGGFFTHYLHTALSGGADRNRDGEVSLSEAYGYVHSETAFHTRDAPELQTPNWDLDLAGAGDLVLTTLEDASARLAFLGDLDGTYAVWDESRKRYVAQVDGAAPVSLAVRPGTFYVHKRMPGWVEESHYTLRRGETHSVLEEDFVTVSYAQVASRGDLEKVVRRSEIPDLSLRFTLGARAFTSPYDSYAGPLALGGVQVTLLGRKTTYFSFDLRTGANTTELTIEELAPIETHQSAVTTGAVVGLATPPNWVRAGIGARASFNVMSRWFPDWDLEPQSRGWVGVGGSVWAGGSFGRVTLDVQYDVQVMPV